MLLNYFNGVCGVRRGYIEHAYGTVLRFGRADTEADVAALRIIAKLAGILNAEHMVVFLT